MFTYQESQVPELWTCILNEVSDFNIEDSLNQDYASRLARKINRVFASKVDNLENEPKHNRWNLVYFDTLIKLSYQIGTTRESYLDKELSPEAKRSKESLVNLKKIALEISKDNSQIAYPKELVHAISKIEAKEEYCSEIRNQLIELKEKLELFKEQAYSLDLNKLIALCVVYLRQELECVNLSDSEKPAYGLARIDHLSKVFIIPVYNAITHALNFLDAEALPEFVVHSNLRTLKEYGHIIYEEVIAEKPQYSLYPDPEIQMEIDKIIPIDKKNAKKLSQTKKIILSPIPYFMNKPIEDNQSIDDEGPLISNLSI